MNATPFSWICILRIWAINIIEVFSIMNFQEVCVVFFMNYFEVLLLLLLSVVCSYMLGINEKYVHSVVNNVTLIFMHWWDIY